MSPSVKGIGNLASFSLLVDHIVDDGYDGLREVIEVENGREGVETNSVELVAILNKGEFTRWMNYVSWLKREYYSTLFPLCLASSILARIASILDILSRVIPFLSLMRLLVSVESFIPKVEDTSFSLFSVSRMMTFK